MNKIIVCADKIIKCEWNHRNIKESITGWRAMLLCRHCIARVSLSSMISTKGAEGSCETIEIEDFPDVRQWGEVEWGN